MSEIKPTTAPATGDDAVGETTAESSSKTAGKPAAAAAATTAPGTAGGAVVEAPARHEDPVDAPPPADDPIIVGFLCEWAADLNSVLEESGAVRGMPNVRVIKIPCSGMTKPAWMEMALKQGAAGVFVCGCPIVDCHFREGNIFIRDRMYSRRTPKPKRLDLKRARGFWYEALESDKLLEDLRQFTLDLKEL